MRQATQFVHRLTRDTAGSVLPLAAVGLVVGATIIGSAVDVGRNYLVRQQLQSACDAGVLAGRRTVTTKGFDTASKTAASTFFLTNYSDATQGTRSTVFNATSDDGGKTIKATATTILDTVLMRLFGKDSFAISVTCGSSMGVGNADIMMVLDTTGSMSTALGNTTRIAALRSAMKNFYTTMSTATAGTTSRVRFGFVPYSSTVNVGRLLLDRDPAFLADSRDYQSREYVTLDPTTSYSSVSGPGLLWDKVSSTTYSTAAACIAAYPNDSGMWVNSGSPSSPSTSTNNSNVTTSTVSQSQRKNEYQCQSSTILNGLKIVTVYMVYSRYSTRTMYTETKSQYNYHKIKYDTSQFKKFKAVNTPTGTKGAMVSSTWAGCIEERDTKAVSSFSYSSLTGYSPSGALDINIDAAPGSDPKGKWSPMWTQVAYTRAGNATNTFTLADSLTGSEVAEYCPRASQGLQVMSQSSFNTYADSLTAIGGTYLDIGMIWGGRLLSPDGIFSSTVNAEPTNGGEVARHIIFMTDGEMDTAYYVQTAWGIEYFDRRVTDNGSTNDDARHTQRFLATCEAIKDKGIRVWVVAFTSGLSNDLKACASDSSSYLANNATELNTAFQEIAKQVGELRVVE